MGVCGSKILKNKECPFPEEEEDDDVLQGLQKARSPSLGNARLMHHARLWELYEYVYSSASHQPIVLGSGASGAVYLVRSKIFPELQFSLKELSKDRVPFRVSETSIYLLIDHPNIAKIVEVFQGPPSTDYEQSAGSTSSSAIYLVNEACLGGELFTLLKKERRFNEITTIHLARQMLKALNYMHNLGIVHGDLKLENFVFDRIGTVFSVSLKLIDFGFSRKIDTISSPKKIPRGGTPLYLAPEVSERAHLDSPAQDIWSVGVIVFMLLTGQAPFPGRTVAEVQVSIQMTELDTLLSEYQLSEGAVDFLQKCMEKTPSLRLSARKALDHPWLSTLSRKKSRSNSEDLKKVANNMVRFASEKPLRRACIGLIGLQMVGPPKSPLLNEVFDMIDVHQEGFLTKPEIGDFLDKFAHSHKPIAAIFDAMDLTGDGRVNYSEFLAATDIYPAAASLSKNLVEAVFKKFDKDKSGFINQTDLTTLFGSRGYKGTRIHELIAEADIVGKGQISLEDFDRLVRGSSKVES